MKRAIIALVVAAVACAPRTGAGEGGVVEAELDESGVPARFELPLPSVPAVSPSSTLHFAFTEHLGQLTGRGANRLEPVGISGTDLGASFVLGDHLVFLFGDSLTTDASLRVRDSAARAPLAPPASGMPALRFVTGSDGRLAPLDIPKIDLGFMEVPVDGFVANGSVHVFFATGWNAATGGYTRSTLAHAAGASLVDLTLDHDVVTEKFANVSVLVDGETAWIYGTGAYRTSDVYLATVRLARVAHRAEWRYFAGYDGSVAAFAAGEVNALPIARSTCAGEVSVRKHPRLPLVLMTYACLSAPRGVQLRLSATPLGPWTEPTRIFDPEAGYGVFMHRRESVAGFDDGLAPDGNAEEWGGEYAPYLVPSYFDEEPSGAVSLVYTMSSWVPYQVHLMRTVLAPEGLTPKRRATKGAGLPRPVLRNGSFSEGAGALAGWTATGDAFGVYRDERDAAATLRVTSFTKEKGDAAVGRLEQELTLDDAARELSFRIAGGDATVSLWRGDERVRVASGRRTNVAHEVRWRVDDFRGDTVRLVIEDALTGPWGFVEAFAFTLD